MARKTITLKFRFGDDYRAYVEHEKFHVGDEVVLVEYDGERGDSWYELSRGPIEGNMDRTITRYHGWRGTTNGTAVYACGVHTVQSVEVKKSGAMYDFDNDVLIIKIGAEDIHPDWE